MQVANAASTAAESPTSAVTALPPTRAATSAARGGVEVDDAHRRARGGEPAGRGAADARAAAGDERDLARERLVAHDAGSQREDDEPGLGHLLDRVARAFACVAAVAQAAVGLLVGAERGHLVHEHAAEVEGLRGAQRGVELAS